VGQVFEVRNAGRLWFPRHTTRQLHALAVGWTLVGVLIAALGVLVSTLDGDVLFGVLQGVLGLLWMVMAAFWLFAARQDRRRGLLV
jgi:hypothetical protein